MDQAAENLSPKMAKRPVGRPRADGKPQLSKEAVFVVAARHIARDGYAGASIRKMATALQAAPASVFNLFPTKDALLNELLAFAATPSMVFYKELDKLKIPPETALFKCITEEVRAIASVNGDFPSIFYLPELSKPGFEPAQEVRANMVAFYRSLIDAGCYLGVFDAEAPDLAAEQVFQLTETSIIAEGTASKFAPAEVARLTARFCLRGLLSNPKDLDDIERAANGIELSFVLPKIDGIQNQ